MGFLPTGYEASNAWLQYCKPTETGKLLCCRQQSSLALERLVNEVK
jgi:hypothetical protein